MANAVERRIETVEGLWNEAAADPACRVIVFRGQADDLQIVEVFLALQNEEVGRTPDLFVTIPDPIGDATTFGDIAAERLVSDYRSCAEALIDEGLQPWDGPGRGASQGTSLDRLAVTCASFCHHFAGVFRRLVLVLVPGRTANAASLRNWLEAVASAPMPDEVAVVVLERTDAPMLGDLVDAVPGAVREIVLDLDMPGAIEELAKTEGHEGPGKELRLHLVALGKAGAARNARASMRAAEAAAAIADREEWPDQSVVVDISLGTALLAAGEAEGAVTAYRRAARKAALLAKDDHPAGRSLWFTAAMSEGSAHYAREAFLEAGATYERACALTDDPVMRIEAWRMAAHCHAHSDQPDHAWAAAEEALAVGEVLDAEARAGTTLRYVGEEMLRLAAAPGAGTGRSEQVERRMWSLLGGGWRDGDAVGHGS